MKKFIVLTNTLPQAVSVVKDIALINATNQLSPNKDRLNVQSFWVNFTVEVKPGTTLYPAELKDWDSVKTLLQKRVFTYGGESDGEYYSQEEIEHAEGISKRLALEEEKLKNNRAKQDKIAEADKERFYRELKK